ncbi:hypothetical protein [Flavimarina sp. Hel_I_48]|uniref:hypothetical protein n=1 Tax=Flavimarina sp. Hel_I_48 TaxID=1392488 RepID=UPI0004DF8286|nr:hypothetical protein [Flavimarina sp. Hel_I_48]
MRYILLLLFSLGIGQASVAQALKLTKGVVNENISINDSIKETFALYVPKDFDPNTNYKTLFLLDPDGNGARASKLFISDMAGDDFIIASNEWKLGEDLELNVANAAAMVQRVASNIRMNSSHIYAAGLKQGATTASALSYVLSGFAGILAIDDIFYRNELRKGPEQPIFMGLVGDASANYYKMYGIFDALKAKNKANSLFEYEGEGEWPQSSYLSAMFGTLYFRAAERAGEELNDTLVRRHFVRDSITAEMLARKQEFLVAYDFIDALKDKYRGKIKLKPLRQQIRKVRGERGYAAARRRENRNSEDELFLKEDLNYFLEQDIATASFENLGYWDERIQELDTAAGNTAKPYEQKVARRMLGLLDSSLEAYDAAFASGAFNLEQVIFYNVLKTVIDRKDYEAYKKVISLTAKDNDDKTAYFYLDKMLKNGYKDYEALYEIPDTEVLHISEEFNKIVEEYFGKSKF